MSISYKNLIIFSFLLSISLIVHGQINTVDIAITNAANLTHSENSVFISPNDPNIILNSNNRSGWPTILPFSTSGQISIDGGLIWPFGVTGNINNSHGDPATAIGRNGRFYVGYINQNFGQSISWSDDNGLTWNEELVLAGPDSTLKTLQDKNHLWIDNKQFKIDGTPNINEGNLYAAWSDFRLAIPIILFSRSTDDGLIWSTPTDISSDVGATIQDQGVNIQTGPNGEVYVCWAIYDHFQGNGVLHETSIGFTKSLDGGQTWEEISSGVTSERIININGHLKIPLGGGKTMRHNSFPVMTVNQQNGEIYIVWTNRFIPGTTDNSNGPDIYMIKSSDQGTTWSTPTRVNQDTPGIGKDQWFPWIACDETSGALVVIYYDSRNFTNNDSAETFVSISYDAGDTWEDFLISDTAWSGDGFVGSYAGDYIGIDVSHGKAVPVWSDDRTGNMLAYTQPFLLPCLQDNITLCDSVITGDAVYIVKNSITVGGPGCNYIITNTGNVIMEAGVEVDIQGEFDSEGELDININLFCNSFGNARVSNAGSSFANNETINEPMANIQAKEIDDQIKKNYLTKIYPNPVSDLANIEYTLQKDSPVKLNIYNLYGQLVKVLVNETNQSKGFHRIRLDAASLQPGSYYYTLITKNRSERRKMLIIK